MTTSTTQGQADTPPNIPEIAQPHPPVEDEPRSRNAISEWAVTALLLLFGTTTLVQAYVIPTPSMESSLLPGDHLLVDKLTYSPPGSLTRYLLPYSDVQRGDIIVFRWPNDINFTYVKRVIGIPGDRIRIENRQVWRNGVKIDEPYKIHKIEYFDSYRDNFPSEPNTSIEEGARLMLRDHVREGEVVVPPNAYFALGDNRDQSSDSRYWGFVPRENIIGKPLIIYWSYEAPSHHLQSSTPSWEHIRDLGKNFFQKTRWQRTLQLIHGHPSKD